MDTSKMVLPEKLSAKEDLFATTPEERLLLATRQHWFTLVPQFLVTSLIIALFIVGTFFTANRFLFSLPLLLSFLFISLLITVDFIVKITIDWYYHFYIVTTRKILEVCYAPLFSHAINEVLLEQLRCTEIDIQIEGVINEIIDMGDVIITFDRPTHQESFSLKNIQDPKKTGILLGDALDVIQHTQKNTRWYKDKNVPSAFRFTEDIFPNNNFIFGRSVTS